MTAEPAVFPDPGGVVAYRPVRDANNLGFRYARFRGYDDGQAVANWGTGRQAGTWTPIVIDLRESDVDGRPLRPARMPYLDIGALLFCGDDAIESARRILEPYGELLDVRTTTGRTDLAIFHALGLIGRGDEREHIPEFSYGTHLYLSPGDPDEIRALGAFRHVADPYGALFLSDALVGEFARAGLIDGTGFRICVPREHSCG